MSNTLGNKIKLTIFGESHSPELGATVSCMPKGIKIDYDYINKELEKRRPKGKISTERIENDNFEFVSGLTNGITNGEDLKVVIKNENYNASDYEINKNIARPSHADYAAYAKYNNLEWTKGGGQFSGRMTTPLVLIGSIFKKELENKEINIGTHILELGNIKDESLNISVKDFLEKKITKQKVIEKNIENIDSKDLKQKNATIQLLNNENVNENKKIYEIIKEEYNNYINLLNEKINKINNNDFFVSDDNIKSLMINKIIEASNDKDSIGAVLETLIVGLDAGIGDPFFDSIESQISHGIFSIPGIKGIVFGEAEKLTNCLGSEFNDSFRYADEKVVTLTNNNAGINGGITNGMPIIFKTFVKPTPSIYKKQNTIDMINKKNVQLEIKGRHDPCIAHRIAPVINNLIAFILYGEIYG